MSTHGFLWSTLIIMRKRPYSNPMGIQNQSTERVLHQMSDKKSSWPCQIFQVCNIMAFIMHTEYLIWLFMKKSVQFSAQSIVIYKDVKMSHYSIIKFGPSWQTLASQTSMHIQRPLIKNQNSPQNQQPIPWFSNGHWNTENHAVHSTYNPCQRFNKIQNKYWF